MPSNRLPAVLARRGRSLLCRCLPWLLLGAAAVLQAADPRPVSIQDLCLMLRSGYSDAEVLQATASRPLLEPLAPADEQTLRAAGAGQRLVDALKTSRRAASPAEALAARQQQEEAEQRNAANAVQQAMLLRSRQTAAPAPPEAAHPSAGDQHGMETLLHGKLVTFRDEKFTALDGNPLEGKKVIGLYFSRLANKAGGTFTGDLVQFYRTTLPKHPEFEVVLVSGDPSLYSMENFVRHAQMPWPAVAFDQLPQVPSISRLQDPSGAARLIVVDCYGRPLADYHIGVDPSLTPQVLPDLAKVIADPAHLSMLAPPPTAKPPGTAAR